MNTDIKRACLYTHSFGIEICYDEMLDLLITFRIENPRSEYSNKVILTLIAQREIYERKSSCQQ